MAISLKEGTYGELLDPFGGIEHMREGIIKTPLDPQVTFSDDPLRMMRAVRFAGQLHFDIEPDTYEAIVKQADRLKIISMERIIDETNKIILSPMPSYGFKLLFHSGLLKHYFPEMMALPGVEYQDNKAHKDTFYHTLQVLDNVAKVSDDLWLRWAAILHDIASAHAPAGLDVEALREKVRLLVRQVVKGHDRDAPLARKIVRWRGEK